MSSTEALVTTRSHRKILESVFSVSRYYKLYIRADFGGENSTDGSSAGRRDGLGVNLAYDYCYY